MNDLENNSLPEQMISPQNDTNEDDGILDIDRRILCSDGACIGVIGSNNLCKVCGQAYVPEVTTPHSERSISSSSEDHREDLFEPEDISTLDLSSRVLCSDGGCIGVINSDGFCKVCHKPLSSIETE